jgi:hypothetical protein
MDDAMQQEVEGIVRSGRETRAEEWHSAEPVGEDQPEISLSAGQGLAGGVPDGMTEQDVELRSRLATFLGKEVWPATGAQLASVARGRQAPDEVLSLLGRLPQGRSFINLQEAWSALDGGVEQHRS